MGTVFEGGKLGGHEEMIAQRLPVLNEAVESIFEMSIDERLLRQYEAHEDYYRQQRTYEHLFDRQREQLEQAAGAER